MNRNPFYSERVRDALDTIGAAVSLALFIGTAGLWLVIMGG